jgi:hypothetical protein
MQQVRVTTLDDGNLIRKIDKALQKLGQDIAARPDITTKRVANIKIGLTPAESYVAIDYQVIGAEPPDAPVKTIAFMDGTQLVKQLPLFDNVREVKKEAKESNG